MEAFLISVNCVAPVFINLLIGYVTKSSRILPETTFPAISRLCFYVLMPFMMFHNIYSADFALAVSGKMIAFSVLFVLGLFAVSTLFLFWAAKNPKRRSLYIQCTYRSNIAVVGIVLAETLGGVPGAGLMTIMITILVPLFNVLSVIALELCRGGRVRPLGLIKNILKTPIIVGALVGILFVLLKIDLPVTIRNTVANLNKTAGVMTLIALGASFCFSGVWKNKTPLLLMTLTRLVFVPLIAVTIAYFLGIRGTEMGVVLICFASPSATTVFPMAQVYGADHELAGQMVVMTSALCCLTLMLWIFVLKTIGLV